MSTPLNQQPDDCTLRTEIVTRVSQPLEAVTPVMISSRLRIEPSDDNTSLDTVARVIVEQSCDTPTTVNSNFSQDKV